MSVCEATLRFGSTVVCFANIGDIEITCDVLCGSRKHLSLEKTKFSLEKRREIALACAKPPRSCMDKECSHVTEFL